MTRITKATIVEPRPAGTTTRRRKASPAPAVPFDSQPEPAMASAQPQTKTAQVLALLRRGEGATLAELVAATGWLPHTTRAALTGLRKKGHAIAKSSRDGTTCYSLAA